MADDTIRVPGTTAARMEDQLRKLNEAQADLRVAVAEVQKDVQVTGERQREVSEAIKSIAQSLQELALVAERQERLQDAHGGLSKAIHGEGGVKDVLDQHHDRIRTVELWISGVKFVVAPALGAILIKEALRLWGG